MGPKRSEFSAIWVHVGVSIFFFHQLVLLSPFVFMWVCFHHLSSCGSVQGFWYFRGRKITENHGNQPTLKITEITENHGKSRKRKRNFPLFAIVVCTEITGNHGDGNESSYCLPVLLLVAKCWSDHGNANESSHCLLLLLLVAKCWSVYFFVCFQL